MANKIQYSDSEPTISPVLNVHLDSEGNVIQIEDPEENITMPCLNDYCISQEDYLNMIEEYVKPSTFEWIIVMMYGMVFVMGVGGNFLVCFAVWRNIHMRTVTNLFIVNLALADVMVCLICLPATVIGDVTETWFMGSVMCKIIQYLQVGPLKNVFRFRLKIAHHKNLYLGKDLGHFWLGYYKDAGTPATYCSPTRYCLYFPAFSKVNTRSIPPLPTYGSIWVVLWLLFFRSAPCTFPQRKSNLLGAISGSP